MNSSLTDIFKMQEERKEIEAQLPEIDRREISIMRKLEEQIEFYDEIKKMASDGYKVEEIACLLDCSIDEVEEAFK